MVRINRKALIALIPKSGTAYRRATIVREPGQITVILSWIGRTELGGKLKRYTIRYRFAEVELVLSKLGATETVVLHLSRSLAKHLKETKQPCS